MPSFPKKIVKCAHKTVFLGFLWKYSFFSKKLLSKKIFCIKFLIKKAIFIFGVRWHLTGSTVTQLDANKIRVEGGDPKYHFSGALPAPESFPFSLAAMLYQPFGFDILSVLFILIRLLPTFSSLGMFYILFPECSWTKWRISFLYFRAYFYST